MRRQRRSHINRATFGMRQNETAREQMQLALHLCGNGAQRIGAARIIFRPRAIFRIADNRMTNGFRMSAQLVRAACDRLHRQPSQTRRDFVDGCIKGHRMLRIFIAMFGNAHFFRVAAFCAGLFRTTAIIAHAGTLGQEERDAPLRGLWHTFHHRPINLLRLARAKEFAQVGCHFARTRNEQHARCIAVQSMHEQRAITFGIGHRHEHAVNMVLGARAPLHRQTIRLVEHDDVLVFKDRHLADGPHIFIRDNSTLHRRLGDGVIKFERRHAHGIAFRKAARCLHA